MTVSYAREALEENGHAASAHIAESLGYDVSADVAGELREAFGGQVDAAYFNGNLESLKEAVDGAAERPGTFDEISTLLDRVGDESLPLSMRVEAYDRVYELLDQVKR